MRTGPGHGLWWASPVGSLLLVVPVSIWLAWSTSDLSFRLLHRTPKVLTDETSLLFAAGGAALLTGALLAAAALPRRWPQRWPDLSAPQLDLLERAAAVTFWLTVTGYLAFAVAAVARGVTLEVLLDALLSQVNDEAELDRVFEPVTGITTLTQVGVAHGVLAALCWTAGRRRHVARRFAVVVALALLRSFFLTERLALLEVLLPALVVLAIAWHRRGDLRMALAPLLALPGLVVVFGAFEYSRSWAFFRTRTTDSYASFVLDRLAGYYATAYNNGAAQLEDGGYPGRLPYTSIEGFWTAPGIAQLDLYERLSGRSGPEAYAEVLQQRVSPEFTNPCGVCSPFVDFGVVGGLVFLLLAGLLVGLCWAGARTSEPFGLLLYPVVFTGLLELPRYLYWTQGRVVPAVVALLVVAALLRRAGPRQAVAPPVPVLAA